MSQRRDPAPFCIYIYICIIYRPGGQLINVAGNPVGWRRGPINLLFHDGAWNFNIPEEGEFVMIVGLFALKNSYLYYTSLSVSDSWPASTQKLMDSAQLRELVVKVDVHIWWKWQVCGIQRRRWTLHCLQRCLLQSKLLAQYRCRHLVSTNSYRLLTRQWPVYRLIRDIRIGPLQLNINYEGQ